MSEVGASSAAIKRREDCNVCMSYYLVSFDTLHSLFLLLFAEDDEWAAVFVECETHCLPILYANKVKGAIS